MSNSSPFSNAEITVMREMVDRLLALDDITGGWTSKIDAHQTGFSLHVKFDNRSSVDDTLQAAQVFDQAPVKLCQIASRVLDQLDAAKQ